MKNWEALFKWTLPGLVVGILAGVAWGPGVEASGLTPLVDNIRPSVQAAWTKHSTWLSGSITVQFTGSGPDADTAMSYLTSFTDDGASWIAHNESLPYTLALGTDTARDDLYKILSSAWITGFNFNTLGLTVLVDNIRGSPLYTFAWDTDSASNGPYGINSISVKSTNPEDNVLDYAAGRRFYGRADILKERKEVKCLRGSKLPITNIGSVIFLEGIINRKQEAVDGNKN